jgi:hypothetical protein
VDLFAEMVRSGKGKSARTIYSLNGDTGDPANETNKKTRKK